MALPLVPDINVRFESDIKVRFKLDIKVQLKSDIKIQFGSSATRRRRRPADGENKNKNKGDKMEKNYIVRRKNRTFLLSRANWERITYIAVDQQVVPALRTIIRNGVELHIDSTVDLADVDISYYTREANRYRNYTTEKKEKTIVRKIQTRWVFWKNRKTYGGVCLYVRLKNDIQALLNEGFEKINPPTFRAERLPATADGQLAIIELDGWVTQNYAAEFKRVSGLDVLLSDLIADQPTTPTTEPATV